MRAHLALVHEFGEGGERLLDRGRRVGGVQLVQVDAIGREPA